VLKKELNWKSWRPDCDEKLEIKRGILSTVQGNDSIGVDSIFTLMIPLDILQDPQDIIPAKNLRYVLHSRRCSRSARYPRPHA
jgi:hypothetical protein